MRPTTQAYQLVLFLVLRCDPTGITSPRLGGVPPISRLKRVTSGEIPQNKSPHTKSVGPYEYFFYVLLYWTEGDLAMFAHLHKDTHATVCE